MVVRAHVALFGESVKEAREYLEYNAPGVFFTYQGRTQDTYLFKTICKNESLDTLRNLQDITIYTNEFSQEDEHGL